MKARPEIARMSDPEPASPCANICVMDDRRGLCRGCARTLGEIANWPNYTRAQKIAVLERVAQRKAAAGSLKLESSMPLSSPAPRQLMHNRAIECRGYERADGLWDIEGHLVDTKTYATTARDTGRPRQPGEPVHNMWLRLTIDLDMKIHDAEAVTDDGPYALCGEIAPNFKALKGVTIGPGWRRKTLELLGGTKGCTHLVELLGPLGTTAFQATGRAREQHNAGKPVTRKPYQLNACHVYNDDGPAVKERWPQFYTGPRRRQN